MIYHQCKLDHVNVVDVVRRVPAVIIIGLLTFLIGLGSALNIDVLINQVLYMCICTYMDNFYVWQHVYNVCTYVTQILYYKIVLLIHKLKGCQKYFSLEKCGCPYKIEILKLTASNDWQVNYFLGIMYIHMYGMVHRKLCDMYET